jgi:transcriptional regulator with XRE-family HTH domain
MEAKRDPSVLTKRLNSLFANQTQMEVCNLVGMSQTLTSGLKRGKLNNPGADILFKVALAYDVSIDWIVGISDDPGSKEGEPIGQKLGLSDEAANALVEGKNTGLGNAISYLIEEHMSGKHPSVLDFIMSYLDV